MLASQIDLVRFVLDVVRTFGVLVAATWSYFLFFRQRSLFPRIELDLDCRFVGVQQNDYVSEIAIMVNNKSILRQEFTAIDLRIRGIEKEEPLQDWIGRGPRLSFPNEIMRVDNIIPDKYSYFYAEPGIAQSYNYVTKISASNAFIVVHIVLHRHDGRRQSAERVYAVKS